MLWWDSVAPLGNPVVPEVYWMLIGSSALSSACRRASSTRSPARQAETRSSHSGRPMSTTCRRSGQSGRTSAIIDSEVARACEGAGSTLEGGTGRDPATEERDRPAPTLAVLKDG